MKKKTKPEMFTAWPKSYDAELTRKFHEYIKHVTCYATNPGNWPLTLDEQAHCIRRLIHLAKAIEDSEAFKLQSVRLAAEELALTS